MQRVARAVDLAADAALRAPASYVPRIIERGAAPGARGEILFGQHSCRCALAAGARTVYRAWVDAAQPEHASRRNVSKHHLDAVSAAPSAPLSALLRARGVSEVRAERSVLLRLARDEGHQGIVLDVSPLNVDFLPAHGDAASAARAALGATDIRGAAPRPSEFCGSAAAVWRGVDWDDSGAHGPATVGAQSAECAATPRPRLLLALDGVTDPHNLGACLRSALLLHADGVILPQKHSAPLNSTVSRTSAGALDLLAGAGALRYARSLSASMEDYARAGWRVLGAAAPPPLRSHVASSGDTASEARGAAPRCGGATYMPCDALPRQSDTVLVVGSEGFGLSPSVRAACSAYVYVPTAADVGTGECDAVVAAAAAGGELCRTAEGAPLSAAALTLASMRRHGLLDSLNVSTAVAILLHSLRPTR